MQIGRMHGSPPTSLLRPDIGRRGAVARGDRDAVQLDVGRRRAHWYWTGDSNRRSSSTAAPPIRGCAASSARCSECATSATPVPRGPLLPGRRGRKPAQIRDESTVRCRRSHEGVAEGARLAEQRARWTAERVRNTGRSRTGRGDRERRRSHRLLASVPWPRSAASARRGRGQWRRRGRAATCSPPRTRTPPPAPGPSRPASQRGRP
jgi:hypothetical protein